METTLIGVGISLVIAAILGGGIKILSTEIPKIASGGKRIGLGIVGVLLFAFGYFDGPIVPPVVPQLEPPNPNEEPVPVAIGTLSGTVDLFYHESSFRERYIDYSIRASAGSTQEFSTELDVQGRFRIDGVPETPQHTVSWGVSRPSEFVIWPLTHPRVAPGVELREFRFRRLQDVFIEEKIRMREAVTSGNFGEADERLRTILQLFERLGIPSASSATIADQISRWRFTIHRDSAEAAERFRGRVGQSEVTERQVEIERQWRRTMINAALEQPAAGQQLRDFVRAVNSWAAYAREVYSRAQRSWPDRSIASRQSSAGAEFLERDSYAVQLREDIVLIKEKLATPQIQALIDENANRQEQMARLSDGQRLAIGSFSFLLRQDADRVSLNQFVNLLSALHLLIGSGPDAPTEPIPGIESGTLDFDEAPTFGSVALSAGFLPYPHTLEIVSGGEVDVDYLGGVLVQIGLSER